MTSIEILYKSEYIKIYVQDTIIYINGTWNTSLCSVIGLKEYLDTYGKWFLSPIVTHVLTDYYNVLQDIQNCPKLLN